MIGNRCLHCFVGRIIRYVYPDRAKVGSNSAFNCLSVRVINREPKLYKAGSPTAGPPISRQTISTPLSVICQSTVTLPPSAESLLERVGGHLMKHQPHGASRRGWEFHLRTRQCYPRG